MNGFWSCDHLRGGGLEDVGRRAAASHLELVLPDEATGLQVLPYLMEDGQHGDVGLAGTSGSADEQVLVGVVGRLEHDGLDPVQPLHPFEHQLSDLPRGEEESG